MLTVTQGDIDRAEIIVSDAERKLAAYTGNKFLSKDYYDLKGFASQVRSDLEVLKSQREAEFVAVTAERSVAETAATDYIKSSAKELDVATQALRTKAVAAQDALVEFLNARQELEDDFTRISGALTVRGLKLDGDYKNGAEGNCIRLNGTDYIRPQANEAYLACVVARVANARIRGGGFIGGFMSRFTGVRFLFPDIPLPKSVTFPAIARPVMPERENTEPEWASPQDRANAVRRQAVVTGRPFNPSEYFPNDPDLSKRVKA